MPDSDAAERSATDRTPSPRPPAHDQWQQATLISTRRQSKSSRTLTLRVPGWSGHLPGQHVDVRLTAGDGYTAQRSFSLAEPSSSGRVAITVDLVPHGEVSPYLVDTMDIGNQLDVRGPIGGWFVWRPSSGGSPKPTKDPILLMAGGSGVVPLVTMLRARNAALDPTRMLLVYSLRDPEDLMYTHDLEHLQAHQGQASPGADGVEVRLVYTRHAPPGSPRSVGHLTATDLQLPPAWGAALASRVYLCGSSGFVEHATNLLHTVGYSDQHIRIERFGPSGVES